MSTTSKRSVSNLPAPTPSTGSTTPDRLEDAEKISSQNLTGAPEDAAFVRPISNKSWAFVFSGLLLGAMLYGLDTTIAADVQAPILESLGEIEKLAWVGIGFPMGSVGVILLFGWLYELFEIKYLFIASVLIFEIGSAVCGAAPNMNAMIIGRVIAGAGGSGMYMGALTYNTVFTSTKERPLYNAAIGLCWGVGAILGPLVGGGFSESKATWRWAFYINLPLMAALAPVYLFLNPKYVGTPDIPAMTKVKRLDWLGIFLNAGVWTLFQVACTFSGSTWKWNEPGPIALWVFFGAFVIALIIQQYFMIFTSFEHRLIPLQILKSRTMLLLYVATAAASAALAVMVYFIPLFFVFTKGDSAIKAAVRLLPFICVLITFVMVAGGLLPAIGRYAPFYIIAGVFITIGGALMHTIKSDTSAGAVYGFEVLTAIGTGIGFQIAYSVSVVVVKPSEIMGTIGIINTAQIGSTAIALSIASAMFQNIGFSKLGEAFAGRGFGDAEIRGALAGAKSIILGADAEVLRLAIEAIVETMSMIWVLLIVAGALCLIAGVLMKQERLTLQG